MINFLKYKWLYFLISASVLLPGIFSLFIFGLRPSIDFTGGSVIEVQSSKSKLQSEILREVFKEKGVDVVSLQGDKSKFLIKSKPLEREKWEKIKKTLREKFGEIEEVRFETVGPILGRELLKKTLYAAVFAVLGILAYIAWAFRDLKYGISAVIALLHDLFVVVGTFSLLGHFYQVEVDILFVTALLTTMSFSVHDTIVVFDRIRESLKSEEASFEFLVNKALTETMCRSVNNSMTIIFMLLALTLLGGATIKWFVFALLVGTISGTYSSPFVATPTLFLLKRGKLPLS